MKYFQTMYSERNPSINTDEDSRTDMMNQMRLIFETRAYDIPVQKLVHSVHLQVRGAMSIQDRPLHPLFAKSIKYSEVSYDVYTPIPLVDRASRHKRQRLKQLQAAVWCNKRK